MSALSVAKIVRLEAQLEAERQRVDELFIVQYEKAKLESHNEALTTAGQNLAEKVTEVQSLGRDISRRTWHIAQQNLIHGISLEGFDDHCDELDPALEAWRVAVESKPW